MKLVDLRDLLLTITPDVYHFESSKALGNYIVWAEDGEGSTSYANNHMALQSIQGTIDYYTKIEFDPVFDIIQAKLNTVDIAWKLNSIQHEQDTGYIHYEWTFEVVSSVG